MLLAADRLGLYDAKVVETTGVAGRNLSGSLPDAVAVLTLVLEAVAVVAVWLLYARARDARARLPVAFAAAVAGFLAFTKVFSPQYLVWLVPLVVLAGSWVAVSLTAFSRSADALRKSVRRCESVSSSRSSSATNFLACSICAMAAAASRGEVT